MKFKWTADNLLPLFSLFFIHVSSLCPLQEEERQLIQGPSTGAVIGAILGALIFICIVIIGTIFFIRNRQEDAE